MSATAGHREQFEPTERQLRLLCLVAEQKAIPTDQLARFLGLSAAETERLLEPLSARGLLAIEPLLSGESHWVWLRRRGATRSGTGFKALRPNPAGLSHLREINEVRLRVESSSTKLEWVSERGLRRARGGRPEGFLPDAAIRIGGEVHAVEVELSRKPAQQLEEKLAAVEAGYDVVVYFTTPEVGRCFRRLGLPGRHPKLVLKEIVASSPELTRPDWRLPDDPAAERAGRLCFDPSPFDLGVLDLLAEQGAIPMDQLCEFLGEPTDLVEQLVGYYLRAGLLRRARPVPSEAAWVWLTLRGMAASSHELSEPRPRVGGLATLRAVNAVRLLVAARPGVRWVSGRVLRREQGRRGSVPKGVIEFAGERHAVDVWLSNPSDESVMSTRLRSRQRDYDVSLWFYSRRSCARIEQFAALSGSQKLVARPLPGVDMGDLRPESWRVDVAALRPQQWGPGGSRRRARRTPTEELWARLRKAAPSPMCRVAWESVPGEALRIVAEVSGADRVRPTGEAWRRLGGSSMVFRLETDVGVYRVIRSRWGWRAAVVLDESVFELLEGPAARPTPPPRPRRPSKGTYKEIKPPSPQLGDDVWDAVRLLIPPIDERPKAHRGRRPLPDRVMVDGVVYLLRTRTPLHELRRDRGYGTEKTMRTRLRYWDGLGVWEPLCEELRRRLPDGDDLDWSRLVP